MEQTWVRSMLLCIGYYLVGVLWYGLFACRPWLICVIPAHCGWCSERLISALEEANIRSWHTATQHIAAQYNVRCYSAHCYTKPVTCVTIYTARGKLL